MKQKLRVRKCRGRRETGPLKQAASIVFQKNIKFVESKKKKSFNQKQIAVIRSCLKPSCTNFVLESFLLSLSNVSFNLVIDSLKVRVTAKVIFLLHCVIRVILFSLNKIKAYFAFYLY